jgi:hypothetical protein
MDERMQTGRETTTDRSAPSTDDSARNGRREPAGDERSTADRSSAKPALTDRERTERWPLG